MPAASVQFGALVPRNSFSLPVLIMMCSLFARRIRVVSLILSLVMSFWGVVSTPLIAAQFVKKSRKMSIHGRQPDAPLDPFARSLYEQLSRRPGNLTFSPPSIEACVLLALAGAGGTTADEIAEALKLDRRDRADLPRLLDRFRGAVSSEKSGTSYTIANSVWVQKGYPLIDAYRRLLESGGRATFGAVDFAADPAGARQTVNAWVDEATHHKISQLLGQSDVTAETRLVLANAIYFKSRWQAQFDPISTSPQPFHRPGKPDVKVPLMYVQEDFRYYETDAYQVLELPYEGTPHAMVVWLPKQVDGLPAFERELIASDAAKPFAELQRETVEVFLPRFKIVSQLALDEVLEDLGMRQAFTAEANFSGISREPLMISTVVHQALVEVDEEGTEAAAATGAVAAPTAATPDLEPVKVFRADHPFLFAIRNTTTGRVLFLGRYFNPEE